MPIIKSAKKRVRTAEKAAIRNGKIKRSLRTAFKVFHKSIVDGDTDVAAKHSLAQSNLDKAVKKGILTKNKVARQKSQLAAKAKAAATAEPVKKAAAPKKTTAKTTKPAVAKKAAPKAAAKNPAAKK